MSQDRLSPTELDAAMAEVGNDAPVVGSPTRRRSRVRRVLAHPAGALAAVLLVLAAVLGGRSYLVSRPPPLATTIDAAVGASFSDSGFVYVDGTDLVLALVIRATGGPPVQAREFLGPGITGVVLGQNDDRVSVSATADCADLPPREDPVDYRLRVVQQDAWHREVTAELPLPSVMARQVGRTLRLTCTLAAVHAVELLDLHVLAPRAAVATLVNRGTVPVHLYWLAFDNLGWNPGRLVVLPPGGESVEVRLAGPACSWRPPRGPVPARVSAGLAVGEAPAQDGTEVDLSIPRTARAAAARMATACSTRFP